MKSDCRVEANLGWYEEERINNNSCIPRHEFNYQERDNHHNERYQLDVKS